MTKKKNIASKLVLVLFVLTLISCCLLGSTFARYVSGGTGSASVGIAKWDVTGFSNSMGITVDNISPSQDEKKGEHNEANPRKHMTEPAAAIATITNDSEVDAFVTVTLSGLSFQKEDGSNVVFSATGWTDADKKPSQEEMMKTVQLQFATEASPDETPSEGDWNALTYRDDGSYEVYDGTLNGTLKGGGNTAVSIWFRVVWVSQDGTNYADELDTWIGQNVETISATLSYTAVQFSELPEATP